MIDGVYPPIGADDKVPSVEADIEVVVGIDAVGGEANDEAFDDDERGAIGLVEQSKQSCCPCVL